MKTFAILVTAFLLVASAASAAPVQIQYKDYPTDNTDPTVKTCIAYSDYGQKCKRCDPNFAPTGAVIGWTCVQVANSQNFCTCGDMSRGGCSPKGLCTYQ